jgi:hypothetical protein
MVSQATWLRRGPHETWLVIMTPPPTPPHVSDAMMNRARLGIASRNSTSPRHDASLRLLASSCTPTSLANHDTAQHPEASTSRPSWTFSNPRSRARCQRGLPFPTPLAIKSTSTSRCGRSTMGRSGLVAALVHKIVTHPADAGAQKGRWVQLQHLFVRRRRGQGAVATGAQRGAQAAHAAPSGRDQGAGHS